METEKECSESRLDHKAGKNLKVKGLNIYTAAKINYEQNTQDLWETVNDQIYDSQTQKENFMLMA